MRIGAARLVVAALIVGALITAGFASHILRHGPSTLPGTCVVRDEAFLAPRALGSFTRFVDGRFDHPPFFGIDNRAPFVTTFRVARQEGYIADVALRGRYRQAEDAVARAAKYTVGRWPLVPLTGAVVRDHGGELEIYQTNWSFGSWDGADAWLRSLRQSGGGMYGDVVKTVAVRLGDDTYAFQSHPPGGDLGHERVAAIVVRQGTAVLTVRVQGGKDITVNTILPLTRAALSNMVRTCAGTNR